MDVDLELSWVDAFISFLASTVRPTEEENFVRFGNYVVLHGLSGRVGTL